ncbi:hypothetical protein CFP66_38905 [Pseudonocardia sp. MH-G8]|nr:hypothetical protein CFP66_38905 [Pseudonocardia sp. MH-G8]
MAAARQKALGALVHAGASGARPLTSSGQPAHRVLQADAIQQSSLNDTPWLMPVAHQLRGLVRAARIRCLPERAVDVRL